MDIQTFKKKLIQNKVSKTVSFVLTALTVVFLILGLSSLWADKDEAMNLAGRKGAEGSYAYLDVIAFEDWVCKYGDDTYYTLYDESGEAYLAVISDREMKKMTEKEARKEDYIHYFDGSYRLYGLVKWTDAEVISLARQAYDISNKEFKQHFGSCCFNTTENPRTESDAMWQVFALFAGIFAAVAFIIWIGQEIPFNRECRDYGEEEFAEAARMMDEADPKQKLIFGEKYIVNRNMGSLVRYEDILWIHLVQTYMNGVYMGKSVGIHTRNRNYFKLAPNRKDSGEELREIQDRILEKRPDILIGYTKENQKEYDSLTRS